MPPSRRRQLTRRSLTAAAAVALVLGAQAASGNADLAGRVAAGRQRAAELHAAIAQESKRIRGYEGSIASLRSRLAALDGVLAVQERELTRVQGDLATARRRLTELRADYGRDRQILAGELVAQYESPPPTVVNVVVDANGFDDLLSRVTYLRSVQRRNIQAINAVRRIRRQVGTQAVILTAEERRRARQTAAVLVERDQIAQLKLSIVERELPVARARSANLHRLGALEAVLSREVGVLDRQAAAAQAAAYSGGGAVSGGCVNSAFVPHGGAYGFFQAAGTNYSVGEEPIIAARLDALGRALQLHLVGISGYRSPAHSVEVGGFADDPHTLGLASDTPGVEGVPEAALARFCLTRPFPGAREADHIQEL